LEWLLEEGLAFNPKQEEQAPKEEVMTRTEMRDKARLIGILQMKKKVLEEKLKALKKELGKHVAASIPTTKSASGNEQHVLEMHGFSCKVYDRTQLYAKQAKAREILHPNTFAAIFHPSTFQVVDIRPTKETQMIGLDKLTAELGSEAA
jgi:hypothetical protein